MVKRIQNNLSAFADKFFECDHFVRFALKGLIPLGHVFEVIHKLLFPAVLKVRNK